MYSGKQLASIGEIFQTAKASAIAYYALTERPLGITGELGEYEAAIKLKCKFKGARNAGHDLIDCNGNEVQVKTRVIRNNKSQRVPTIAASQDDKTWHYVLLVLLGSDYEVTAIYKADNKTIEAHFKKPRPKNGKPRRNMPVREFIAIGEQVWPKSGRSSKK